MHGKADALLHLRGESPRLAGALTPLLPCAPEQTGTKRDRVNTKPGWEDEDNLGTWEERSFWMESQHCTLWDCTSWKIHTHALERSDSRVSSHGIAQQAGELQGHHKRWKGDG